MSVVLSCLTLTLLQAPSTQEFRLKNGVKVILLPRADYPVAMVALGIRAGVYDEPEGRRGLAHLAEHLFWYGASASYPAGKAFDLLSRNGPLGQPYMDANAETLWNLTYFYAARPAAELDTALEIFAEKLRGVTFDKALVAAEKQKVLMEIDQAEQNLKRFPGLAKSLPRHPKAGLAADVRALEAGHVEAFLASHYQPDRAVLLVQGAIDVATVRQKLDDLFGSVKGKQAGAVAVGEVVGEPRQAVIEFACAAASPREWAALRVLAAAWEVDLRKEGTVYVEYAHGAMRVVLMKPDIAVLQRTREDLLGQSADALLERGRRSAGERLRQLKWQLGQKLPAARDQRQDVQTQLQLAIWRLQFEAEGGQEMVDELAKVKAEDVEAVKKYLKGGQGRVVPGFRKRDFEEPGNVTCPVNLAAGPPG
jgi:hypothetical protein